VPSGPNPRLHLFDLSWIRWTVCCTKNSQQVEGVESGLYCLITHLNGWGVVSGGKISLNGVLAPSAEHLTLRRKFVERRLKETGILSLSYIFYGVSLAGVSCRRTPRCCAPCSNGSISPVGRDHDSKLAAASLLLWARLLEQTDGRTGRRTPTTLPLATLLG